MDLYTVVKNAIITGHLEPGQRLTEEWLANEFNVSRTPIREVIQQLIFDGLVTPLKRGVTVRTFTKEDIRQIYDLRALLESYAASQAAIYRSSGDIAKMTEANVNYSTVIHKEFISRTDMVDKIVRVNNQFHETVIKAAKNEHLKFHISKVVVLPLVFRSFYWYDERQIKSSLTVHETIVEAIRNRDADRSKIAMKEHIYQGRDHVLNHMEEIEMI